MPALEFIFFIESKHIKIGSVFFNPPRIFKIATLPCRINTYVCMLLFFNDPFLQRFFATLVEHDFFQVLVVIGDRGFMPVDT